MCTLDVQWWLLLFSHSVVSDSLRPQRLKHNRLLCPSSSPGVCSNSCPLNQCCHPTISSSVARFFSCPQCFPASGSFPMESTFCVRWPKYWSLSFSISSSNENSGLISFRIGWFDFLDIQGTLKSLLQHRSLKASVISIIWCSAFFMIPILTFIHDY